MMTSTVLDHARAYALAVRAHLGDLPPEQVDDLTDGLEADLAAAVEDGAAPDGPLDLAALFGPPAVYAAELRGAAGLPPAASAPRRRRPGVVDAARRRWGVATTRVQASPLGPVLAEVRPYAPPLWWVVRGWVWFVVLNAVSTVVAGTGGPSVLVPRGGGWFVAAALVAASFWLGARATRGQAPHRVLRVASVGAAVLAVPLALGLVAHLDQPRSVVEAGGWEPWVPEDGVWVDGEQVHNLYPYDADGAPLDGVQLFDDRGRPVTTTSGDDGTAQHWVEGLEQEWLFTATPGTGGRSLWNVYPLLGAPVDDWQWRDEGPRLVDEPTAPPAPFARASAVERPAADGPAGAPTDGDPGSRGPAPAPSTPPAGDAAPEEDATTDGAQGDAEPQPAPSSPAASPAPGTEGSPDGA